ncbi:MAG: tRNA lysidine(34) synthetase TilS, partial [Methylocystaceae bacterium]
MRRDRLEQKVLTYIKAEGMIESGSRVLLAVSGGADSMALVAIFVTLAAELNIELAVAHLDHGLRPSSWQEAELVEMYCRQFKLPLYAQTTDVGMYCREQGLGIESGAREVRHRWLREAAAQFGAGKIATAHHRDDQVETILLHLLRGSG